jgi:hypothetical protein
LGLDLDDLVVTVVRVLEMNLLVDLKVPVVFVEYLGSLGDF